MGGTGRIKRVSLKMLEATTYLFLKVYMYGCFAFMYVLAAHRGQKASYFPWN